MLLREVSPRLLLLDRSWYLLPPRFEAIYSQMRARFAQREHVGLSLEHFNLEAAQNWQLSRNLGATRGLDRLSADDGGVGNLGGKELIVAIVRTGGNTQAERRPRKKRWEMNECE